MNPFKLILFSLPLSLCLFSCDPNTQKGLKKEDKAQEIKTVYNDDVEINVSRYGQGELTLLFVHGWCINKGYWTNQVEELKSDYKVVTMDLPGFGLSGKSREEWSIQAYAADVNAVIAQLELDNVVLVGHSMGGNIVLEAALNNNKVIALVGVDNFKEVGLEYTDDIRGEIEGFLGMLRDDFPVMIAAYAESALFHPETDSLVRKRVVDDFLDADRNIALSSLESLFGYTQQELEKLSAFQGKLYLINSDATPTDENGLLASGVAYEVIDINTTGHYPMIEKPQVFNQLLRKVLNKIEAELSL